MGKSVRSLLATLALLLLALAARTSSAHETDQYTLPLGREFANLGPHLSRIIYGAVRDAMDNTNTAIKRSLDRDGRPTERTLKLQSADFIAGEVWGKLFAAFPTNEIVDTDLTREHLRAQYPGLIVSYAPEQAIYDDPLLMLDLTKLVRLLFRASTVSVDGKLFGTDKIIHFINLGRIYHSSYEGARMQGLGEWESVSHAFAATDNFLLSENGFLGMFTTGIHSNGDLAADYAGFKFYRNLTEEVHIGSRLMPAMLVHEGLYWRLNHQVRPDSDFFTAFITPHWNEALNPNVYNSISHARLRAILRSRCPDVLDWYRDERGQPLTQQQFAQIEKELSTFYGEDYGYESDGENTVSIATTCFQGGQRAGGNPGTANAPDLRSQSASALQSGSTRRVAASKTSITDRSQAETRDRFGRTELWWAARDGKRDEVERLLKQGADANAADIDGEGPLHAAARSGEVAILEALLAHGANPDMKALYGTTPLHVSVLYGQTLSALALLRNKASANFQDLFGKSPLHDAVLRGDVELVVVLLDFGANPVAADDNGATPLKLATRGGNNTLVNLLSSRSASAKAGN